MVLCLDSVGFVFSDVGLIELSKICQENGERPASIEWHDKGNLLLWHFEDCFGKVMKNEEFKKQNNLD